MIAKKILDKPNERSLHKSPIPRIGGLAILAGIFISWIGLENTNIVIIFVITISLGLLSFIDDLKHLPAWMRFLAHLIAAGIATWTITSGQIDPLMLLLVMVTIVWVTNLFNFMDGSDGLAGGMAMFGFLFFAIQALIQGSVSFAGLNAVIAAAAAGFLLFNTHPARVFMGDVGSIPLGFLAGLIGYIGWADDVWPFWYPVLIFSPFIVDASITLIKRLLTGKKIWQAHCDHYYQHLILLGFGHRNTALLEYVLMILVGLSSVWGASQPVATQIMLLVTWGFVYLILAVGIERRWQHAKK